MRVKRANGVLHRACVRQLHAPTPQADAASYGAAFGTRFERLCDVDRMAILQGLKRDLYLSDDNRGVLGLVIHFHGEAGGGHAAGDCYNLLQV